MDEWHLDRPELALECRDAHERPDPELSGFLLAEHAKQAGQWAEVYEGRERFARDFVQQFAFARAASSQGCPSAERLEPMRWDDFFVRAVRRQFLAAVLLQLAAAAEQKVFRVRGGVMQHAELDQEASFSFHWGDGRMECGYLARQLRRDYGPAFATIAFTRHLYVFVDVSGAPSAAQDILNNEEANADVTRAGLPLSSIIGGRQGIGEIVDATPRFGVIDADEFLNRIRECRQSDEIRTLAQSALNRALAA